MLRDAVTGDAFRQVPKSEPNVTFGENSATYGRRNGGPKNSEADAKSPGYPKSPRLPGRALKGIVPRTGRLSGPRTATGEGARVRPGIRGPFFRRCWSVHAAQRDVSRRHKTIDHPDKKKARQDEPCRGELVVLPGGLLNLRPRRDSESGQRLPMSSIAEEPTQLLGTLQR